MGTQENGTIKGVDESFKEVIQLDSFLLAGKYRYKENKINYGIIGLGMKVKLNININDRLNPITVYMFSKKKRMVGSNEFSFSDVYPTGVFSVKSDTDSEYVISTLEFTEKLLGIKGQYSALEFSTSSVNNEQLRDSIRHILGQKIIIKDKIRAG